MFFCIYLEILLIIVGEMYTGIEAIWLCKRFIVSKKTVNG